MSFPNEIRAGDSVTASLDLADYLQADGWSLEARIVGAGGAKTLTVVGTSAGWDLTLSASDSADLDPGIYRFAARATNGSQAFTVEAARLTILPDLMTVEDPDLRSHVEKVLNAIEATLEGVATRAQQALTINGKSISTYPPSELLQLRTHYKAEYSKQLRADRARRGLGSGQIIMRG